MKMDHILKLNDKDCQAWLKQLQKKVTEKLKKKDWKIVPQKF